MLTPKHVVPYLSLMKFRLAKKRAKCITSIKHTSRLATIINNGYVPETPDLHDGPQAT